MSVQPEKIVFLMNNSAFTKGVDRLSLPGAAFGGRHGSLRRL